MFRLERGGVYHQQVRYKKDFSRATPMCNRKQPIFDRRFTSLFNTFIFRNDLPMENYNFRYENTDVVFFLSRPHATRILYPLELVLFDFFFFLALIVKNRKVSPLRVRLGSKTFYHSPYPTARGSVITFSPRSMHKVTRLLYSTALMPKCV